MLSSLAFDPMHHDTPGNDLMALDFLAKQANAVKYAQSFVEVGSWAGLTAYMLRRNLPADEPLYCVDHWKGSPSESPKPISQEHALLTFAKNVGGWGGRIGRDVIPCVGDSLVWAEIFSQANMRFKLVFIDANHDAEAVRKDILAWWPLVEVGGILCGHDYGIYPGVNKAVDYSFAGKHKRYGLTLWAVERCNFGDSDQRGYKLDKMSMEKMQ